MSSAITPIKITGEIRSGWFLARISGAASSYQLSSLVLVIGRHREMMIWLDVINIIIRHTIELLFTLDYLGIDGL